MLTFINDDKIENVSEFSQWLQAKLTERGWKASDLAKRAGLGNSTITRILDGSRRAGPDVCNAIAEILEEEPDEVFRLAGLLPEPTGGLEGLTEDEANLLRIYRKLTIARKKALLSIVSGLGEKAWKDS